MGGKASAPGRDGWEATHRLKKGKRTREIRIVALTSHSFASARELALKTGCDGVLTKPVMLPLVEAEVRRQLDLRDIGH